MLAFKSLFSYVFIWREATTRKHEVFSSLALNIYETNVSYHRYEKCVNQIKHKNTKKVEKHEGNIF